METLKINEIFYSIQGESSYSGFPTTFVRTSGCHLRCTYCDTTYAYNSGKEFSIDQIISEIDKNKSPHVCVTGGEPLLQKNIYQFLNKLCLKNFVVSLETSGDISCSQVHPNVKKIIDVKTPDSGEFGKFSEENLPKSLNEAVKSEYKFVICSEKDFNWAEEFSAEHNLFGSHPVLYSPSFGKINAKWLAEKILSKNSQARLQLQLHKYIWNPEQKGV